MKNSLPQALHALRLILPMDTSSSFRNASRRASKCVIRPIPFGALMVGSVGSPSDAGAIGKWAGWVGC